MNTLKYKPFIFLATVLLLLANISCESDLNVIPQGLPTEDLYWRTEAEAIIGINGVYADLSTENHGSEAMYGRGYFWLGCVSDDMAIGRSRARVESMRDFTASGNESELYNLWRVPYLIIKRANDVLRNVPNMSIDEKIKKKIIAEASFLSGLMYFQLAPIYGDEKAGVPILDPLKPLDYNKPRATNVTENYNYIISLLQAAAEDLPYFHELKPSEYGRAHKTAAWAYLAKTHLYAKNYEEAEKVASKIVSSGNHTLLKPFEAVFKVKNNFSTEYIWSALGSVNPIRGSMLPGVMLENKGWGQYNGWGYMKPTKELYDSFEEGDPRREATILKPGDIFTYFGNENFEYKPGGDLSYHTGLQFKKYMDPFKDVDLVSSNGNYPTTELDIPLMRYAEVLLILAEAKLMQGKNADAEINEIRNRVGLPELTGVSLADLKRERRSELAGEINYRHFDLIRWGDAQQVYSKPKHKFDGTQLIPGRKFNPEIHHVWPLPPEEIVRSEGVLVQNQGW
ncbi:MAG: RagB/SusD family nutrient uptake outer membrane protein [Tenacibaculum sp.]